MCRARRLSSLVNANLVLTLNAANGTWYLVPGTWYQLCYVWYVCMYVCMYACIYVEGHSKVASRSKRHLKIKMPFQNQNAISRCHLTHDTRERSAIAKWHPDQNAIRKSTCIPRMTLEQSAIPKRLPDQNTIPKSKLHLRTKMPSQN